MRDLGGLPICHGTVTRWRGVVRGDSVDHLTDSGRSAMKAYGITTVIDLRNGGAQDHSGLTRIHVPLDDRDDTEFWSRWSGGLNCTPLYYSAFLARYRFRVGEVVSAIADADPGGGVLVHCAGGRDRTGLVIMLLLASVGLLPDAIAADYALSTERLEPMWKAYGVSAQAEGIEGILRTHGATAQRAVLDVLENFDACEYLSDIGISGTQMRAIRSRLLGD